MKRGGKTRRLKLLYCDDLVDQLTALTFVFRQVGVFDNMYSVLCEILWKGRSRETLPLRHFDGVVISNYMECRCGDGGVYSCHECGARLCSKDTCSFLCENCAAMRCRGCRSMSVCLLCDNWYCYTCSDIVCGLSSVDAQIAVVWCCRQIQKRYSLPWTDFLK
jgi:hypothetical protein